VLKCARATRSVRPPHTRSDDLKAIVLMAFGGPECLELRELPTPVVEPEQVLVAVRAAGICHHDVLHRSGKLPGARLGVVLGHETAGEIVAVGARVHSRKLGDRVVVYQRRFCGVCRNCLRGRQDMCRAEGLPGVDTEGGYAEFVAVPAVSTVVVPDGLDWTSAALSSCPIATSLRALRSVAQMAPGDTVLVTGASGGLGVHQLQLIRAFGGRAIAVTTSADKAETLRELGADEVVVSPALDYAAEVWKLTGKLGVDFAIENVGATLPETLRCMTHGGTVVLLGNIGTAPVSVSPGLMIGRRLRVCGSGSASFEDLRQALSLLATGVVKPVVAREFSFSQAALGHALLDSKSVAGRVVLQGW
jgi:acryloyl-coenzyme A reductase